MVMRCWMLMVISGLLSRPASAGSGAIADGYGDFTPQEAVLPFSVGPPRDTPVVLWPPTERPAVAGSLRMQISIRGFKPGRMMLSRQLDVVWERVKEEPDGTTMWRYDVTPRASHLSAGPRTKDNPQLDVTQRFSVAMDAAGRPMRITSEGEPVMPGFDMTSQLITQLRPELPTEPIAPGFAWDTEQVISMPLSIPIAGSLDVRRTGSWMYRGQADVGGRDCAVIVGEVEGVIEMALERSHDDAKQLVGITRSSGVLYLDGPTGEVVYGVQSVAISMDGDGIPYVRMSGASVFAGR